MDESKILITGSNGQLGRALQIKYPRAQAIDSNQLDISNEAAVRNFDFSAIEVIINAAAYTDVDGAETPEGRRAAWRVNAGGVANLARAARHNDLTLVHISTDYVFDGMTDNHKEDEALSPLSIYGASKAASELAASGADKLYLLRTAWVVGDGKNFVRTMLELGKKGVPPTVVHDQTGRLTFTTILADAIDHLLVNQLDYGIYNVSNEGEVVSWADVARTIFHEAGMTINVTNATTSEYYADKPGIAPRPLKSAFDLSKIEATGFKPNNWHDDLRDYIKKELAK